MDRIGNPARSILLRLTKNDLAGSLIFGLLVALSKFFFFKLASLRHDLFLCLRSNFVAKVGATCAFLSRQHLTTPQLFSL